MSMIKQEDIEARIIIIYLIELTQAEKQEPVDNVDRFERLKHNVKKRSDHEN